MKTLLLSGGLDSVCALWLHRPELAITINYGQSNWVRESDCATRQAHAAGAEHLIIQAPVCFLGGGTLLSGFGEWEGPATIVPGRNAILVSIAASITQARGGGVVILAAVKDDAAIYPDCRQEFVFAMDKVVGLGSGQTVGLLAPFVNRWKREVLGECLTAGHPVLDSWSCYKPGPDICGECGACKTRAAALPDVLD